mmetsp:Transcript_27101/g.20274  ORF Transcript_27101/g.20274 Transcript_27101/m.20274 type:complete len:81 (+) Transcript_27101:72-314(+)
MPLKGKFYQIGVVTCYFRSIKHYMKNINKQVSLTDRDYIFEVTAPSEHYNEGYILGVYKEHKEKVAESAQGKVELIRVLN